jgi:hypothetical protein
MASKSEIIGRTMMDKRGADILACQKWQLGIEGKVNDIWALSKTLHAIISSDID